MMDESVSSIVEWWREELRRRPELANSVVDAPDWPTEESRCQNTVLHLAVGGFLRGTDDDLRIIVQLLLEHGADPNRQNDFGRTPLHMACDVETRDAEIARTLIGYGADPNLQDHRGRTPLDLLGADAESQRIRGLIAF